MRYCSIRPVRIAPVSLRLVRWGAIGVLSGILAGCASSQQQPQYAGVYQVPAPRSDERASKVDLEDDGRPAQLPPARRPLPEEDDPSQPWSPNYGKQPGTYDRVQPPPARTASLTIVDGQRPAAPPVSYGRTLHAAEADAIVLRAIQNHEVRKP